MALYPGTSPSPQANLFHEHRPAPAAGAVLSVGRSSMIRVCLRVYLAHHEDGAGRCARCGTPIGDCARRRRAASVLAAAGIDPTRILAVRASKGVTDGSLS